MKNTTQIFLTILLMPILSYSQTWDQVGMDIDGEAVNDNSGGSISMSSDGSILAIGAYFNAGNGFNAGHVRVYERDNNMWTQKGGDIDGEAAGDLSGLSVSLNSDGKILAIGGTGNGGNGSNSGHVRVYEWMGSSWVQKGMDIDGEAAEDKSGYAISIDSSGNTLAIGAILNGGNGTSSGQVRVFQWDGANWVQKGSDIDGESPEDQFGVSVDISSDGETFAAGSRFNDGNGTSSGHVRVFKWNGIDWIQKGADIDGDQAGDEAGIRVNLALNGDRMAIGAAQYSSKTGQVKFYSWSGTDWIQLGNSLTGVAVSNFFGFAIDLSADGNTAIIGSFNEDAPANNGGRARAFKWDGVSWSQVGGNFAGEAEGDWYGRSVCMSSNGTKIAIGALYNDGNGSDAGHVRAFDSGFGVGINSHKLEGISIYPNPNKGWVNMELGSHRNVSVRVFTEGGQLIYQKNNITTPTHRFELEGVSARYFIKVASKDGSWETKLIKE